MAVFYRRLPKFEYLQPDSLEEVLSLMSANREKAKIAAGGTDLIVQLRRREIPTPDYVLDIKKISLLKNLTADQQGLKIGALVPIAEIAASESVKKNFQALAQSSINIASPQIRNRATFTGNICNAVPSADSAPPLLVLDASVKLKSVKGERSVPIAEFFTGVRKTAISPDEIVTEIFVPQPASGAKSIYHKHSQRHSMDLALVGAAVYSIKEGDTCREIRIALGAVAPTPMRAAKAEKILSGHKVTQQLIDEAAHSAAAECSPIDDHRASAEYRRDMVQVLVRRALTEILL
ncbi:MAG: xanthine dehydrogenase family protein subunit M [Spirochaetia bacterium]|jgi:carbon-monoxide dehydrogenase medium subunit|nr:xanthine dehydrogenase family protein subunit M [Spirochaetia bacterium]